MGYRWTHPEAWRFLTNWTDRYHVLVCPRRAGKSFAAAKKALPVVLGRQTARGALVPTMTWVVGATYELAAIEFGYLWQDLVTMGPGLGWGTPLLSRRGAKELYLKMSWGSEVVGKSADKPQSLLGRAVDCIILSESAWLGTDAAMIWSRYLEPSLATRRGFAIFPTTPDASATWLYELWVQGLAGERGIAAYTWPVTENPTYPIEELEYQKARYGEGHPVFREQYLGQWVFYTGTVYGADFDPTRNLIDPFEVPPEWPRLRAIDFGYRDPFVCLWLAVAPDGRWIVEREYYQAGRPLTEHATAIRQRTGDLRVLKTVGDPSAQQAMADLRRLGIPVQDAVTDRRAGRMAVGDAFRSGRLQLMKGRCPETIRELAWYRWADPKDRENAKELTIGADHAMDALRYLVMARHQAPKRTPRVPVDSFVAERERRTQSRRLAAWSAR